MLPASKEIIDNFEIIECIKKDEHSAVYKAVEKKKKRNVILKALNTLNLPDNSILERFKRESKILSGLEHPNINSILNYWSDSGHFFISFEYFEGKNLRALLKTRKLSTEDKKQLIIQLFEGIKFAHDNKIIHRDIKPDNILISDDLKLKLVDFGLALGVNDSLVTAQYSIVGTPTYISPEQIRGERPTYKSDLFSAGIVCYEIYTGTNPFLGNDINDTLNKIISYDEEEHLRSLAELPEEVKTVISLLLKKEPEQRINSAEDVLALLRGGLGIGKRPFSKMKAAVLTFAAVIFAAAALVLFRSSDEPEQVVMQETPVITAPASTTNEVTDDKLAAVVKEDPPPVKEIEVPALKTEEVKGTVIDKPLIKKKGSLFIECIPWAYIYIDSVRTDITPLKSSLVLDEGEHLIQLSHPNYPGFTRRVVISENEETRIKVNLDTLFGYLDCHVNPWGEIYLNGRYMGDTPLQAPIKIVPGEYKVSVRNKNYAEAEFTVKISRNQTFVLNHIFRKE